LVDPVAAELDVGGVLPDRLDAVGFPHLVDAPDLERVHAQQFGKVVNGAFEGESGLRGAVAAEAAGRHHVGIDRVTIGLLVDAAIGSDRADERRCQRLAAVAGRGAGVGDDVDLHRGERAVLLGADLHMRDHRMARGGADELLLTRVLPHHWAADLERSERAQILGDHLLLAAEAAADALGEDVDVAIEQAEQIAKLLLGNERRLRAGAHMQASVVATPGERAVRLKMHVLHPRGRIGHFMNGVGLPEAFLDAAELTMNVDIDVVSEGDALLVQNLSARLHGEFRVEHRGQELVVDLKAPAAFFGGALGLGHDRGHPLTDEAHDIVEHVGVVGIDQMILMRRGGVELARHVLPGEHGDHAGHRESLVALDRLDARMRVWRAQHLEMQRAFRRHVERVARLAGDDRLGEGIAQAPAAGVLSGHFRLNIDDPVQGVIDAVIAGAAAKIALEPVGEILARRVVEGRGGHDHAGGAEAALKGLRIEKRLLHRVQLAVLRQAFDGGDLVAGTAEGGHEARVKRHAVEPYRAGAAVALVAAFLDAEEAEFAQEGPEALTGRRFRR